MLHDFLEINRTELIARCREKVALRHTPDATAAEMEHGVPLFLGQLIDALRAERVQAGPPRAFRAAPSQLSQDMNETAARHGSELLERGFSIDQVVHDYGDLCQAITELAWERREFVGADEFRILNGCLDDAIAGAVTEFGLGREQQIAGTSDSALSERLGYMAHELRNSLNTAVLAYAAIKEGHVGLRGATSEVLEQSLMNLRELIDRPFVDVRLAAGEPPPLVGFALGHFLADVRLTTSTDAKRAGCNLVLEPIEPALQVKADKPMLYSALTNVLLNAIASTPPKGEVRLRGYADADQVRIEVEDQRPGLSPLLVDALTLPAGEVDSRGDAAARGLSVARRALESMGGQLRARALSLGCVFTLDLPRFSPQPEFRP